MNLIHGKIVGPGKNAFGLWQQTTGKGHCFEGKAALVVVLLPLTLYIIYDFTAQYFFINTYYYRLLVKLLQLY